MPQIFIRLFIISLLMWTPFAQAQVYGGYTAPNPSSPIPTDASYRGGVAMTVGTLTYQAWRGVGVNATVAGNVSIQMADGSAIVVTVPVGWTELKFSAVGINSSGTTATATYYDLR